MGLKATQADAIPDLPGKLGLRLPCLNLVKGDTGGEVVPTHLGVQLAHLHRKVWGQTAVPQEHFQCPFPIFEIQAKPCHYEEKEEGTIYEVVTS